MVERPIQRKVRVLVVDDSAIIRQVLQNILKKDPLIEIAGIARDGREAIEKIAKLQPDVVTLDIEMPRMDGLTALERIMSEDPLPVLMVSSLTQKGADATMKALSLGAADFIGKQLSNSLGSNEDVQHDLVEKVKTIAKRKRSIRNLALMKARHAQKKAQQGPNSIKRTFKHEYDVLAIGSSTGGPSALEHVLSGLAPNLPVAVLVVQHMPAGFTKTFASRLNQTCDIEVKEAENDEEILPGRVYIAPGSHHLTAYKTFGGKVVTRLALDPDNTPHRPSVDVMIGSVAEVFGGKTLGVILTGMGSDGANGLAQIKHKNGTIIAQDEETCVVYGMPKAVVDRGLADFTLPLDEIADQIGKLV